MQLPASTTTTTMTRPRPPASNNQLPQQPTTRALSTSASASFPNRPSSFNYSNQETARTTPPSSNSNKTIILTISAFRTATKSLQYATATKRDLISVTKSCQALTSQTTSSLPGFPDRSLQSCVKDFTINEIDVVGQTGRKRDLDIVATLLDQFERKADLAALEAAKAVEKAVEMEGAGRMISKEVRRAMMDALGEFERVEGEAEALNGY